MRGRRRVFFNRSLTATLRVPGTPVTTGIGRPITANTDPASGALTVNSPLPRFLLVPERFTPVGFAGEVVSAPSMVFGPLAFSVERLDVPARIAYTVTGADAEGNLLAPAHRATIRLFEGARPECRQTQLVAPSTLTRPLRFTVEGAGVRQAGLLAPGAAAVVKLHSPAGAPETVRIAVAGTGGRGSAVAVAATLGAVVPVPCTT